MLDAIAERLTRAKIANLWVTYLHELPDGNGGYIPFYAGVCRLSEVFSSPDASMNSEWKKYFDEHPNAEYRLRVMNYEESENAAITHILPIRRMFNPHCNAIGVYDGRNARVECLETGIIYNSASEACRTLNLSQSALSNHLNGRVGYKKVRGMTFRKVS
jgi:hypothetical protein